MATEILKYRNGHIEILKSDIRRSRERVASRLCVSEWKFFMEIVIVIRGNDENLSFQRLFVDRSRSHKGRER